MDIRIQGKLRAFYYLKYHKSLTHKSSSLSKFFAIAWSSFVVKLQGKGPLLLTEVKASSGHEEKAALFLTKELCGRPICFMFFLLP